MADVAAQADEAAANGAGEPVGFTHRQIVTALSGLLLAVLLAALDQTIVATALRTIGDHLHGQTVQAWVITGYLVSSTIAMPFYGKLSDIYGRKPLFLAAIVVFVAGSAACAAANSMEALAVARVIQGAGGAGLMSLPTAVVADLAPVRERGRYFSYLMVAWVAASVLGPPVGGLFAGCGEILGVSGWRWAFLINVPLGLLALLGVRRALNLPHRRTAHRIDWHGALALALCLLPLLVVAEKGSGWGWGSARSLVLSAVSLVGLVLFVVAERARGPEAMVPLRLFRRGGIAPATAVNFTIGVGIFGTVSTLPLFLQLVQGRSAEVAGLVIIPVMTGAIVSQTVCARIIRKRNRYKKAAIAGLGSMAGALLAFSVTGPDTPLSVVALIAAWLGAGIGLSQTVITLAVQSSAPASELGVANAASGLFRQLGGTIGAALFMAVLFGVASGRLDGANPDRAVREALTAPDSTGRLTASAVDALATGFDTMFLVGGLILTAGLALTFRLRELPDEE